MKMLATRATFSRLESADSGFSGYRRADSAVGGRVHAAVYCPVAVHGPFGPVSRIEALRIFTCREAP